MTHRGVLITNPVELRNAWCIFLQGDKVETVDMFFETEKVHPDPVKLHGQEIFAIVRDTTNTKNVLASFCWGWRPGNGSRLLATARFESASEKPMWMDAFRTRRCIVPFSAFYTSGHRYRGPSDTLNIAGIYQPEMRWVAVLTQGAKGEPGKKVDRMPLILPNNMVKMWLNRGFHEPNELRDQLWSFIPELHEEEEPDSSDQGALFRAS